MRLLGKQTQNNPQRSLRLVFYALSGTTYGREVVPVRVRVAL